MKWKLLFLERRKDYSCGKMRSIHPGIKSISARIKESQKE
jgi:hypothetical protein